MDEIKDSVFREIYQFVLACGSEHTLYSFALKILTELKKICPFDEGLIYFLDGNTQVKKFYLFHIDDYWNNLYLEYYDKIVPLEASFSKGGVWKNREQPGQCAMEVIDWDSSELKEFVQDFIHDRGLKYTCAFLLYDLEGKARTVICIDRTREAAFRQDELQKVELAIPLLNNHHKKFFAHARLQQEETLPLTPRELQVATMLCRGLSPASISKTLYIAITTTYKHIDNICKKLHVSNTQELIVKMLTSGTIP